MHNEEEPTIQATVSLVDLFAQKLAKLNYHEDAAKALRHEVQTLRDQMTGIATKKKNTKAEKAARKHGRGARKRPAAAERDQTLPGTEVPANGETSTAHS